MRPIPCNLGVLAPCLPVLPRAALVRNTHVKLPFVGFQSVLFFCPRTAVVSCLLMGSLGSTTNTEKPLNRVGCIGHKTMHPVVVGGSFLYVGISFPIAPSRGPCQLGKTFVATAIDILTRTTPSLGGINCLQILSPTVKLRHVRHCLTKRCRAPLPRRIDPSSATQGDACILFRGGVVHAMTNLYGQVGRSQEMNVFVAMTYLSDFAAILFFRKEGVRSLLQLRHAMLQIRRRSERGARVHVRNVEVLIRRQEEDQERVNQHPHQTVVEIKQWLKSGDEQSQA